MKIFVLFLAVAGVSMTSSMSKREVGLKERINEPLSKHGGETYSKYGKEKTEELVDDALEYCGMTEKEINRAIDEVVANLEGINMDELTVCHAVTNNLESAVRPLTSLIDVNCNKKHNIGNYSAKMVESIVSLVDHVYHTDGEHLLELMNPCFWSEIMGGSRRVDKCIDDVADKYIPQIYNGFKDESMVSVGCGLSRDLFDQCVKVELEHCKLQITKDSITQLAEAMRKPCL